MRTATVFLGVAIVSTGCNTGFASGPNGERNTSSKAIPAEVGKPRRLEIDLRGDRKAEIEVTLVPDKQEIMVGESLYLSFQVRNLSGTDLEALQGFDQTQAGGDGRYYLRVVDEKGKALPDRQGPSCGSVLFNPEKIPSKGTWVHRLFLPSWVKLTADGDYSVISKTTLKFRKYNKDGWDHFKDKTPSVSLEAQARLRVVPQDHGKMGVMIDKLGKAMLGKNESASWEATKSLSYIEDNRVIPFFNKAMETRSYDLKFSALSALAKFKSDEALVGLKKGMTTQASDFATEDAQLAHNIRISAADSLTESPNPDAKALLLSMRDDRYNEVRIRVLWVLGDMNTPESLEILRKMTDDPDKRVRDKALEYLKLRTEKPKE